MELLSKVFLGLILVLFLLLYFPSKRKYESYVKNLNKKDFALKDISPIGFSFLDKIGYKYNKKFDRDMRKKIMELHDEEYNEFYLRVYYAMAVSGFFLGLLISAFLFAATVRLGWLVFGLVISGVLVYATFNDMNKKIEKFHNQVAMDLPDYISKITILTSAGLTLRAAMKRVSEDMSMPTPLYDLMKQANKNMENGMNENMALDRVVRQCNMPEMRRVVSVVEQNLQRGGGDVAGALQAIGDEMWNKRKSTAKQLAKEAETKMLFPMIMMMFSVIIITVVPALLGMSM